MLFFSLLPSFLPSLLPSFVYVRNPQAITTLHSSALSGERRILKRTLKAPPSPKKELPKHVLNKISQFSISNSPSGKGENTHRHTISEGFRRPSLRRSENLESSHRRKVHRIDVFASCLGACVCCGRASRLSPYPNVVSQVV
jgi:hypothetical protein